MVVCPNCQFDNPVHHRYCQECGDFLGHEPMTIGADQERLGGSEDGRSAAEPLSEDSTFASQSKLLNVEQSEQYSSELEHPSLIKDVSSDMNQLAILLVVPSWMKHQGETPRYLDQHQRYKILTSFSDPVPSDHSIEVVVMDLKPDDPPYREAGQKTDACSPEQIESLIDGSSRSVQSIPEEVINFSPSNFLVPKAGNDLDVGGLPPFLFQDASSDDNNLGLESNELIVDSTSPNINLPLTKSAAALGESSRREQRHPSPIEQIYLSLEEKLYPSFPQLFDSWTDHGTIVVIENRESLTRLNVVLSQSEVVMPQVLHWLHEMTELWDVLGTYRCCCSLLALDNIRVDEDQILCLKRLHFDRLEDEYTLQDLGTVWQRLSKQSSQPWADAISQISHDLVQGVITDITMLRERLETVADQIHQETIPDNGDLTGGITSDPQSLSLDEFAQAVQSGAGATDPSLRDSVAGDAVAESSSSVSSSSSGRTSSSEDPTIVLPMQLHTLSNAGITNIGIQRDHNEDFFAIDTQIQSTDTPDGRICQAKGLYILCDGMGGHAAGEVASALAGETLQLYFQDHWTDSLPPEDVIYDGVVLANQVIYEQNQANDSEGSRRMGTTLVMLLVQDTKAAIAHVGDSRIYRFTRRQGLEQLTIDHEVGQREIARGVDPVVAYSRPDAYQLTQALGPRAPDFIRPDIKFFEMHEDALFILGSDGLTDNDLLETYCEQYIEPLISTNANLDEGAYNLIDLANQVNGHDNITALLVRVKLRPKLFLLGR